MMHSQCLPRKNFFSGNIVRKLFNFETERRGIAWNGHQIIVKLPFTPKKKFFQDDIGDIRKPFLSAADLLYQLRWLSPPTKRCHAAIQDTDLYTEQDAAPDFQVTSTTQDPIHPGTCIISLGSLTSTSVSNTPEHLVDATSDMHLSMLFGSLSAAAVSASNSPEPLADPRPNPSISNFNLSFLFEPLSPAIVSNRQVYVQQVGAGTNPSTSDMHLSMLFGSLSASAVSALNSPEPLADARPNPSISNFNLSFLFEQLSLVIVSNSQVNVQQVDAGPNPSTSDMHLSMLFGSLSASEVSASNNPEPLVDARPNPNISNFNLSFLFEPLSPAIVSNSQVYVQQVDVGPIPSISNFNLSVLFEPLSPAIVSNSQVNVQKVDARPNPSISNFHLSMLFESLPTVTLSNNQVHVQLENARSDMCTSSLHLSMLFEPLPVASILNTQAAQLGGVVNSLQQPASFSGRMPSVSQQPLYLTMELNINLPVLTPHQLAFKRTLSGDFLELGGGVFGVVYLATCVDDGRLVAVKLFYHAIELHAAIVQEAKILKLLEPTGFVPRLYGLCPEAWDSRKATIVQKFYGNGVTLRSLISNTSYWQGLTLLVKLNIVYQLVYGLKIIHENCVLINDIKDDNILVNTDDHRIRYIDFGHATYMCGKVFPGTAETNAGYMHLAPEARAGTQTTVASDVYSLGYMVQRFQLDCLQELVRQCLQNEAYHRPDLEYMVYVLEEML